MRIGTDDPNMNFEFRGRKYKTDRNGLAKMPDSVAKEFLKSDIPGVGVYHGTAMVVGSEAAIDGVRCDGCAFHAWAFSEICPRCGFGIKENRGKSESSEAVAE